MNTPLHPTLQAITARIEARSAKSRQNYLGILSKAQRPGPYRSGLGCANAAHAYAAMPSTDKWTLTEERAPNLGIITAYNDMLSAHRPYENYPAQIRTAAREVGATAQVAGGVPAMCDGVTQGYSGMELSLFSRDVIAMATAVGLSHAVFDGGLLLGVCDKIVPGLFMGAMPFGHLPMAFVPAGPMTSGLSNSEKSLVRQRYAQGQADRATLLAAEQAAYHSEGTCTFYGTANSNQMLLEIMGFQLPGSSFVNPGTPLRDALTQATVHQVVSMAQKGESKLGMGHQFTAAVLVNGMVGLLATGGSTNHTLHLVAMARAGGWHIDWDDFAELSSVVPLLARVYPNGEADVNHFHAAGGMGFLMHELLRGGLLHENVPTLLGQGWQHHLREPWLNQGQLAWREVPTQSGDLNVLRPIENPFSHDGGLQVLHGNLGRAVIKVSAVKPAHRKVHAPAVVVDDPHVLEARFKAGTLSHDFVAVVRQQGPRANGMPELHKLTPILGVLQDQGFQVALVTDGRMSGASGKVPAAIHVTPEMAMGGPIAKVRDGDMILLDCASQTLKVEVDANEWAARSNVVAPSSAPSQEGNGRELFALFRQHALGAEEGASPLHILFGAEA